MYSAAIHQHNQVFHDFITPNIAIALQNLHPVGISADFTYYLRQVQAGWCRIVPFGFAQGNQ
ncbi:hypothetical protein A3860_17175 [Niastella vici]|uniref:Uncharacterized protein n=1 Tax=Niastella vici TaxID=1703345 RepID=A0A1V9G482_9BACT|nr:hypothetical protein A3860_17175 [Niastella vici]